VAPVVLDERAARVSGDCQRFEFSPQFSATYASIARRRGKKIATIAISRKLLTRAYHLLADAQAAQA